MNTNMLSRVRAHFNNPMSPTHTNRHNARAWIKSIRFLQTESRKKWLLAELVQKKEAQ